MATTIEDIKRVLWAGADTFRGVIDAANYKDYVLTMLFIKFLTLYFAFASKKTCEPPMEEARSLMQICSSMLSSPASIASNESNKVMILHILAIGNRVSSFSENRMLFVS